MSGILGSALSGLMAAQRALETTNHNIANVNTEGYSRQRVDLSAKPAEFIGAGYVGSGVDVTTVSRSYDKFINNQLVASSSSFTESDTLATLAARLDNLVSDSSTSLSPALGRFFDATNEVANDPSSLTARQVMVSEGESLAQHFNGLATQFDSLRDQTNHQLKTSVDDINALAENLANLNNKIVVDLHRGVNEQLPNDLLDQRDVLLTKLAEKTNISTITQKDGSVSVFIASGQSLVLGATVSKLSLAASSTDPMHQDVMMGTQNLSAHLSGGELSGLIKFRDTVLDPAQKQLGLVATGFAAQFNAVHTTGFDLQGTAGTNMFSLGTPALKVPVVAASGSTGSVTAVIDPSNIDKLQASDYRLDYNGSAYSLTRLSDNTAITLPAGFPASAASVEGITLTQATAPTGVSSFIIRPTFEAAKNITSTITDPMKIAAGAAAGKPGDNTVALQLANLEKKSALLSGKSTIGDAYSQMVTHVGTATQAAKTSSAGQQTLLNHAKQARESLAGVNLDEEAANLMKFQQSYQAAAQAIAIANSLFDTLLGAVRN